MIFSFFSCLRGNDLIAFSSFREKSLDFFLVDKLMEKLFS